MSNKSDQDVINSWHEASVEAQRPFYLLRPKMFKTATGWKVVYGANDQTGLVAYGATPDEAGRAFDCKFRGEL